MLPIVLENLVMIRINRIPLLQTLTLVVLFVAALLLRLLPGSVPVRLSFHSGGRRGGSAFLSLVVSRDSDTPKRLSRKGKESADLPYSPGRSPAVSRRWEDVPYWKGSPP